MNLPNQLLSEITGCERLRTDKSGREHRRMPRIPLSVRTVMVRIGPSGSPAQTSLTRLRDISGSGIGMVYPHPMQIGETFVMMVPRKKGPPVHVQCAVVRCQRVESNAFVIGARFERIFGLKASHAAPAERQHPAPLQDDAA